MNGLKPHCIRTNEPQCEQLHACQWVLTLWDTNRHKDTLRAPPGGAIGAGDLEYSILWTVGLYIFSHAQAAFKEVRLSSKIFFPHQGSDLDAQKSKSAPSVVMKLLSSSGGFNGSWQHKLDVSECNKASYSSATMWAVSAVERGYEKCQSHLKISKLISTAVLFEAFSLCIVNLLEVCLDLDFLGDLEKSYGNLNGALSSRNGPLTLRLLILVIIATTWKSAC